MNNPSLCIAINLLPSSLLEGAKGVVSQYKAETGQNPTQAQKYTIGGCLMNGFFSVMVEAIQELREDIKNGKEYTTEDIKAREGSYLSRALLVGQAIILSLGKTGKMVGTYAEALAPYKDNYPKALDDKNNIGGVLYCRGVLEKGVVPLTDEETRGFAFAFARELNLFPAEVEGAEDETGLRVALGEFTRITEFVFSQNIKKKGKGAFFFNSKTLQAHEKEIEGEGGENIKHLVIEKKNKSGAYSRLTVKRVCVPTHERVRSVFYFIMHKVLNEHYLQSHKSGGKIEFNIKELVGEGKPFSRLEYVKEPLLQVTRYLQDVRFMGYYHVNSEGYRKLSMSTLGRVDKRKGDAIEELNVFTGFTFYQDGTCVFYTNDKIKDLSPIFYKVFSLPMGKYTDEEMGMFMFLVYKCDSGIHKEDIRTIKADEIMDELGQGNIEPERNKQRYLKEALRILENVKAKDNGERFEVFDVHYDKEQNTAYKILKSLTVSVKLKREK